MLKNSVKYNNYLSNLWMNIYGIKQIVYQPKIFGIRSLFVPFQLNSWYRYEYCHFLAVIHQNRSVRFHVFTTRKFLQDSADCPAGPDVLLVPHPAPAPSASGLAGPDRQAVRGPHHPDGQLVQRVQVSRLPLRLLTSGQWARGKTINFKVQGPILWNYLRS